MKTLELRTNLFSFDPAQLGQAYRVQVGKHYLDAWQALQGLKSKPHPGLPITGLEEMLAVLSGGPVKVNLSPQLDGGVSAILFLKPLPVDTINEALHLWSMDVLRIWSEQLESFVGKLVVTDMVPLPASSLVMPGDISSLAYTVIPWLVGQALVRKPMQSSRPIKLYQSTDTDDYTLLAWDDPVVSSNDVRYASALHAIEPHLVLLRNRPQPYLQLRVKMSQVMPNWANKKKHAWVKVGELVVKARLKTQFIGENRFKTSYEHPNDKLLAYMGVTPFPEIVEGAIAVDADVRPLYAVPPSNPLIASGPGPLFLDQAVAHLLSCLPGTSPLLARKAVGSLRAETTPAKPRLPKLSVLVLAAHSEVMLRLLAASRTLGLDIPYFRKVIPAEVTLTRVDVPDTLRMLKGECDGQALNSWLLTQVIPAMSRQFGEGAKVAIVETDAAAASLSAEKDPKHWIRRILAEHGIATQFIMHVEPEMEQKRKRKAGDEARDFKASNSIIEAMRLSGEHPSPTPKVKAMPSGTTVLSVMVDRIQDKGWATLLPVITRTILGSRQCQVFWFDSSQDRAGRWFDYNEGLTAIHATGTLLTPDQLRGLVTQSFLAPTIDPESPLIVCLDSKLRTFYGGLKDSPGTGLPPTPHGAAVVRIRADKDVAQMSGNHTFSPGTAHFIGPKIGAFQSCEAQDVYYFVSPSNQFLSVRSQRHKTRYDVSERELKDPWQQLGVTEIAIIDPGHFSPGVIAEQVALLCRNAPMWAGHLRMPGPMHLGHQIAADHPILEMRRKSEANRTD